MIYVSSHGLWHPLWGQCVNAKCGVTSPKQQLKAGRCNPKPPLVQPGRRRTGFLPWQQLGRDSPLTEALG